MQNYQPPEANLASALSKPKARSKKTPLETLQQEAEKLKLEITEMEKQLDASRRELLKCEEAMKVLEGN